jgi:hypothetical protein
VGLPAGLAGFLVLCSNIQRKGASAARWARSFQSGSAPWVCANGAFQVRISKMQTIACDGVGMFMGKDRR